MRGSFSAVCSQGGGARGNLELCRSSDAQENLKPRSSHMDPKSRKWFCDRIPLRPGAHNHRYQRSDDNFRRALTTHVTRPRTCLPEEVRQAKHDGRAVFYLHPSWFFCHLKSAKLAKHVRKYNGRVVLRGTTSTATVEKRQFSRSNAHQLLKWRQHGFLMRIRSTSMAGDANDAVSGIHDGRSFLTLKHTGLSNIGSQDGE